MVSLPTHETRHQRYVSLLRERFGPDAADRVPESVRAALCNCHERGGDLPYATHWGDCPSLAVSPLTA